MEENGNIFDRVVTLGPDISGKGGMATVLSIYSQSMHPFHFIPTNSGKSKIKGYFNFLRSIVALPFQRLKGRDILHIHFAAGKSFFRKRILLGLGKALGFKVVMHCHHNIIETAAEQNPERFARILSKADALVVLARSYRQFAADTLGHANVCIINNPILTPELPAASGSRPVTFLFMGLIKKEKGVFDLLEAANILKSKGYDFRIIIGGVGRMEQFNSMVQKYGLGPNIDYRGWMTGDDKLAAYAQSDVLVLPSYTEAMPMVILEAVSAGMPSIATNVGAVPEILGSGGGVIIEPGQPGQLAAAMERYITQPGLIASDGAIAKAQAHKYTPAEVTESLKTLYQSL